MKTYNVAFAILIALLLFPFIVLAFPGIGTITGAGKMATAYFGNNNFQMCFFNDTSPCTPVDTNTTHTQGTGASCVSLPSSTVTISGSTVTWPTQTVGGVTNAMQAWGIFDSQKNLIFCKELATPFLTINGSTYNVTPTISVGGGIPASGYYQ